jgi:hypothetical protein
VKVEIGKYYAKSAQIKRLGLFVETISIGIVPVVAGKNGRPKFGAAVVRIKGPASEEGAKRIDDMVAIVIRELEHGCYGGPKTLSAQSAYAQTLSPMV